MKTEIFYKQYGAKFERVSFEDLTVGTRFRIHRIKTLFQVTGQPYLKYSTKMVRVRRVRSL